MAAANMLSLALTRGGIMFLFCDGLREKRYLPTRSKHDATRVERQRLLTKLRREPERYLAVLEAAVTE